MLDQYQRKIEYLRLSITNRCQLHCPYCRGNQQEKAYHELSLLEIQKIVRVCLSLGIHKIRLTGGEPLLHPDIIEICKAISTLEGLQELTLTTNAQNLLEYAKPLYDAGIHRINISLDSLQAEKYHRLTGGDLSAVLKGIEAAQKVGMHPIKINVVLLRNVNDDEIQDFLDFAKTKHVEVRFIELMPMGRLSKAPELRIPMDEVLKQCRAPKELLNSTEPARHFTTANREEFSVIPPMTNPFCATCNRIRILSDGIVKPCLGCDTEYSIREALQETDAVLKEQLTEIIFHKPKMHQMQKRK